MRMIYTVTFNPALDYVMHIKDLNAKDINRTQSEQIRYGGKGINVSVILTRLGVENKALGFLAGFSGKQLEKMLSEDNIKTDFVYLSEGHTRINVKIKARQEIDINAQGPNIKQKDMDTLTEKLTMLKSGDYLVLAGSVPNTLEKNIYETILEKLSGRGIHFVVDATGDLLLNVLKHKPFLIKPNHFELGDIFSAEMKTVDDIKFYGRRLQEMGAKNVLVSRGRDGAVLLDEKGEVHIIGTAHGKSRNSVGCGDAMVAGFLAGYTKTKDYSYALKLGSACGSATAFSETLATKNEIDAIMNMIYSK